MELVKQFNSELSSLYETKPPISKAKMTSITRTAIKAIKLYKHVVQSVEKFIQKCKAEYKVPGLYVIDSIVRQSRHQFGTDKDVFAPRFARNLQQTFINLFSCPPEDKSKVIRVLNLWQKNAVFESDVIQPLFDLADPNHPVHKEALAQAQALSAPATNGVPTSVKPVPPANLTSKSTSGKKEGGIASWVNQLPTEPKPQAVPTVDANIIQQLQQLQSLLRDGQGDKSMSQKEADQVKFDRKLLDFDYDEEEDEDGMGGGHHHGHNPPAPAHSHSHSHGHSHLNQAQPATVAAQPPPGLDSISQLSNILSNPEVLRQLQTLQQSLSGSTGGGGSRSQQLEMEEKMRKMQEMKQQEEEFDKHLAETVPHLPFANECDLGGMGVVSGGGGGDSHGHSMAIPPPNYSMLLPPPGAMMKPQGSPLEDGEHPMSDHDERVGRSMEEMGGPSVVVLDSDSQSSSPSHRRRRRRSRSASPGSRSRRRSRSGSRTHRKRRRSNSYEDYEKSKQQLEADKERDRERKRKGLPPLRANYLAVCSTTLWVGHLSKLVQTEALSDTFGQYGDIVSINLIPPRGCGFVCMNRRQDAYRALKDLKHYKILGKAITLAWAPGKGMKGKEYKDYWEVEQGVSYIPWAKITPDTDFDLLEEGGMLDEETFPEWLKEQLKEKNRGDKDERRGEMQQRSQSPLSEDDNITNNTGQVELDIPIPAPTLPPAFIPLPEGPQPTSVAGPVVSQPPPTLSLGHHPHPMGIIPPPFMPRLLGPMGMMMGVPPPGLMSNLMHQQMMGRMPPQPVGSPFNPPPGVGLLGPGPPLSQIPLPGPAGPGPDPKGKPLSLPDAFADPLMQIPFQLPPNLQMPGLGLLRPLGEKQEDVDSPEKAVRGDSLLGPGPGPFGQPPPQFSPMSLMKIPPPMGLPSKATPSHEQQDTVNKDNRESKDKDKELDKDKDKERDREFRKRERDYRGERDYRDRSEKDYRKDRRDRSRERRDDKEHDRSEGSKDRSDRDRSRNRDRGRGKWDRDRDRGRDRDRDDKRGRDRDRDRKGDRDKVADRRNMSRDQDRSGGDFPRGGMDQDNFQGPGGNKFGGPPGSRPDSFPHDEFQHDMQHNRRQDRFEHRGPPPEGFAPRGPPPGDFGPRGLPPDGFGPRGPQEGFKPRGPPSEGFGPRGPPPEGFGPRGPPPEGFGPRGPPPEGFGPRGPPPDVFGPRGPPPEGFGPRGPPPEGFGPRGPPPDVFGLRGPPPDGFGLRGPPPNFGPRGPPPDGFGPRGPPPSFGPRGPPPDGFVGRGPPDGFDLRGPPPDGFEPRGPGRDKFDPRGPPPEGFDPRGPPDGFDPRGPPPDGFDSRGPPREGFDPRGPPPDKFDPRGPPRDFDDRGPPRGPPQGPRGPADDHRQPGFGPPDRFDSRGPPRDFEGRRPPPEDFDHRGRGPQDFGPGGPPDNFPIRGGPPGDEFGPNRHPQRDFPLPHEGDDGEFQPRIRIEFFNRGRGRGMQDNFRGRGGRGGPPGAMFSPRGPSPSRGPRPGWMEGPPQEGFGFPPRGFGAQDGPPGPEHFPPPFEDAGRGRGSALLRGRVRGFSGRPEDRRREEEDALEPKRMSRWSNPSPPAAFLPSPPPVFIPPEERMRDDPLEVGSTDKSDTDKPATENVAAPTVSSVIGEVPKETVESTVHENPDPLANLFREASTPIEVEQTKEPQVTEKIDDSVQAHTSDLETVIVAKSASPARRLSQLDFNPFNPNSESAIEESTQLGFNPFNPNIEPILEARAELGSNPFNPNIEKPNDAIPSRNESFHETMREESFHEPPAVEESFPELPTREEAFHKPSPKEEIFIPPSMQEEIFKLPPMQEESFHETRQESIEPPVSQHSSLYDDDVPIERHFQLSPQPTAEPEQSFGSFPQLQEPSGDIPIFDDDIPAPVNLEPMQSEISLEPEVRSQAVDYDDMNLEPSTNEETTATELPDASLNVAQ